METCPNCNKRLLRVQLTMAGEELTMASCSTCDTRQWERSGDVIELATVLDLTAESTARKAARS